MINNLHLHSQLNTWLQWIKQRQLQDETRNINVLGLGAPYIRGLTVGKMLKSFSKSVQRWWPPPVRDISLQICMASEYLLQPALNAIEVRSHQLVAKIPASQDIMPQMIKDLFAQKKSRRAILSSLDQNSKIIINSLRPSEWVIKFNGLSRTADSEVHIVHISCTHWGRVTHICVSKIISIVSDNACRLFGAKPLSEPMLGYCWFDP